MAEPEKGEGLLEQLKQQLARGQITEADVLKLLGGASDAVFSQPAQAGQSRPTLLFRVMAM
jgi:hypothetical protein